MASREALLTEAQRRGLLSQEEREQRFGTISARPGFLERALPAAGQIVGGVGGTVAGGMPGGIAGATAGATAGRAGQQFLRARRGEQFTPQKVAGELGTEAAITGGVETALPVAGRLFRPVTRRVSQVLGKKVVRPSVESFFRFMTGIMPENTERLLQRGPKEILTRKMRSRERGGQIAQQFLGNAQTALRHVNQQWNAIVSPLRKSPKSAIPSQGIRDAADVVEAEFLGGGPVLPGVRDVSASARRAVEGFRQMASGDFIPLDTAIRARQQLDDVIFTGQARNLIAPRQVAALKTMRKTLSDTIHQEFPEIAEVDAKRHILGEATEVIERFSPESITNVARLRKMIDAFEETSVGPEIRLAIQRADKVIAKETGVSLLGAIRDRAAAQAFEPTDLKAVRSWLITAVLGNIGILGVFGATPAAVSSLSTALGVTLSSPRLAGQAIKGTIAAGRGARVFARKTAPVAAAETMRQTFLKNNQ